MLDWLRTEKKKIAWQKEFGCAVCNGSFKSFPTKQGSTKLESLESYPSVYIIDQAVLKAQVHCG